MTLEELFVENYKKLEEKNDELNQTIFDKLTLIEKMEKDNEWLRAKLENQKEIIREVLIIDNGAIKMKETYIWKNYNRNLFDKLVNSFDLQEKKEEEEENV